MSDAALRLRTKVTEGAGSKKAALAMACKLLHAQQRWRRLNWHELVAEVLAGARFKDRILIDEETGQTDTHDDERTREPVAV